MTTLNLHVYIHRPAEFIKLNLVLTKDGVNLDPVVLNTHQQQQELSIEERAEQFNRAMKVVEEKPKK